MWMVAHYFRGGKLNPMPDVTIDQSEYQLTPDELGMIRALEAEMAQLQTQANAVVTAIVRLRKLQGLWGLQGDKLIKQGTA